MKNLKTLEIGKNVKLTLIPESKFKTNLISVYIQRKLDRNEVTKNALLPGILKSGCNKYKTLGQLTDREEELYGSYLHAGASKRGESQVLGFSILSVNEKYLDEKILGQCIEFLNEIINNPLVIDGGFNEEYLNIEKEILKDSIMSIINDKGNYAMKRTNEIMFEGEPYSINGKGYIEDLDTIDRVSLYEHYKEVLKTSPIEIMIEGEFEESEVVELIKEKFQFDRGNIIDIPKEEYYKEVDKVKEVKENMDIAQGKLVMGYRCNVDYLDEEKYYSLLLGSRILGGGADSKLFINVREKESLCYTIYSTIQKSKSTMMVCSGIEAQNYEKTVNLVKEQVQKLKDGDITESEISNAKIAFINSLNSLNDEIGRISDFYFSQSISKNKSDLDQIKNMINKSTKEDIVEAVKNIELDTIYFLSK
ncbi:EF-P 5-aminopentanol modification-associated protein YfmF [Intestinibacter bartlettii]|uniref:Peptidase M16 inactive domain protein n=1 Tax=Intestinibacter bartlettii CAG:1329 TaxID=1263063 RepID=R5X5B6_9FIRM|nr:pitrilysin family protein [Intestinibacter bartlettii]CDA10893.1 peptidase M16 inactive domain protein [Intestinibacter bartlettii CAG:1329]